MTAQLELPLTLHDPIGEPMLSVDGFGLYMISRYFAWCEWCGKSIRVGRRFCSHQHAVWATGPRRIRCVVCGDPVGAPQHKSHSARELARAAR